MRSDRSAAGSADFVGGAGHAGVANREVARGDRADKPGYLARDLRQSRPNTWGRAVLPLLMLGGYLNYERKQHAPCRQALRAGSARLAMIARLVARARRLKENSNLKGDEIDGICTVR